MELFVKYYVHDSLRLSLIWMGIYTFTYVCVDRSQTVCTRAPQSLLLTVHVCVHIHVHTPQFSVQASVFMLIGVKFLL